jgi:hypothetical protein
MAKKKTLASLLPELAPADCAGFEDLSAEEAGFIAEAFEQVRAARRRDFDAALDQALRFVPAPLRRGLRGFFFS